MRKALVLLAVLVAVAVLALTTACDPDDVPVPDESNVDFDTPALREAKQAAGVADCAPGDAKPVDGGLPAITLPCLGGGPDVDLSTLRGPLVVSLWAQSCGPCRDRDAHPASVLRASTATRWACSASTTSTPCPAAPSR